MQNHLISAMVLYPFLGALLCYAIGKKHKEVRNFFNNFVVITEFLLIMLTCHHLRGQGSYVAEICGFGLEFQIDRFRGIYAAIAAFMWMMTTIFSREYFRHYRNRNRYFMFKLLTLGATVGVFLSANLYTTFIFFEIMSFTSYVWVAHDETERALRAAETYMAVAVIGGMVLLMGLFLLYTSLGTLNFRELYIAALTYQNKARLYAAGGCVLFGFAAKAGAFPLHIWLPKAHPVAPAPASALLSGILTKAGVFGIIVISSTLFTNDENWGRVLLYIGEITMFLGAILAMFSINIKRTLACSSMSQIGFILIGVSMTCFLKEHNFLAVQGTFLHMVNHSLIKLDLFMIAGVVYMNLHNLDLNGIRGFGRGKPFINIAFLIGALGIGGFPLGNGYVSKTLLHESIVEYSTAPEFLIAEWIFLISGGLTVAYMTKLYVCVFIQKNKDRELQKKFDSMNGKYMNNESMIAIGGSAVILPLIGTSPIKIIRDITSTTGSFFMSHAELHHILHFFSAESLKGAGISILIGALVYCFVIRKFLIKKDVYVNLWPDWLDLENLVYRPLLQKILPDICVFVCRIADKVADPLLQKILPDICVFVCRIADKVADPFIYTIFPFVGQLVSRTADSLVDWGVLLLRATFYKDADIPHRRGIFPRLPAILGAELDKLSARVLGKEERHSYRRKLGRISGDMDETRLLLASSISVGVLTACIGLLVILFYILR